MAVTVSLSPNTVTVTEQTTHVTVSLAGVQGAAGATGASPPLGTATPLMDGTAAPGSSTSASKDDHRHPTDTALMTLATSQSVSGAKDYALGQLLLGGSTVTSLLAAKAPSEVLQNVTKSGIWTTGLGGNPSNIIQAESDLVMTLYPVDVAHTLDRIGLHLSVSGSAGAVIRMGIYRMGANGVDAALVLDAGTIDGTQAAGDYAITISQAVTPGMYLLGAAIQGAATTRPSIESSTSATGRANLLSGTNQGYQRNNPVGLRQTGVSGALSGWASVSPIRYGTAPVIHVRVA